MKTVKVGFSSSWTVLDPAGGRNSSLLKYMDGYDVQIVPPQQADYLIYTVFNGAHHGEAGRDAIKILFTGENFCPDFNACDYALSFEYMDYGDRHLRMPLYLFYPEIDSLVDRPEVTAAELRARPHFCNFIYSNANAEPERDAFFLELDRRSKVHSAGRHLRNTDSFDLTFPHLEANARKRRYMQDFRFSLAFENSAHPGYVTEKIVDAFIARTVPIYWGDPRIADEFNTGAFVDIRAFASWHAALDYISELNSNENRMLDILNAQPLRRPSQIETYRQSLRAFFASIFDQELAAARRRPRAGFAGNLEIKRRKDAFGYRKLLGRNRV